jgi:hypothetical protein
MEIRWRDSGESKLGVEDVKHAFGTSKRGNDADKRVGDLHNDGQSWTARPYRR